MTCNYFCFGNILLRLDIFIFIMLSKVNTNYTVFVEINMSNETTALKRVPAPNGRTYLFKTHEKDNHSLPPDGPFMAASRRYQFIFKYLYFLVSSTIILLGNRLILPSPSELWQNVS